jgi:hypothetical protein
MRKILILSLIFFISYTNNIKAKTKTEIIPQNQRPSIMELAFLRYLGGTILEIIDTHGDRQFIHI